MTATLNRNAAILDTWRTWTEQGEQVLVPRRGGTTTGDRYHVRDCGHAGREPLAMSRERAIAMGFTPCRSCLQGHGRQGAGA